MFEIVHTMWDWYDGPRAGIANYQGTSHLYQSEWSDLGLDEWISDSFMLASIDDDTFALAMEGWAIWLRWEAAFHQGRVTGDSHPALPEDHARHQELIRLLSGRLDIDPTRAIRARGEFRVRVDPGRSGCGFKLLEVEWKAV